VALVCVRSLEPENRCVPASSVTLDRWARSTGTQVLRQGEVVPVRLSHRDQSSGLGAAWWCSPRLLFAGRGGEFCGCRG
jgi:hypothetical protein